MFNCIKMDLYRMFRMKSFYVIGIILAAATFFTTSMSVLDYNMMKEEAGQNPQVYEQETSSDEEPVNLGMDVTIPTRPGEMVTVYDQVYANLHGKFIAPVYGDFCCTVFCFRSQQRLYKKYRRANEKTVGILSCQRQ